MIINLRGTNGSGKSSIVRKVMVRLDMHPFYRDQRRQPIGYYSDRKDGPNLWIVGHYETDCGGCDTITSLDDVYGEIKHAHTKGYNVLYEGIMASGEYRRCVELHKLWPQKVQVLALDVPINTCLQSITERRASRSNPKPVKPDRTIRRLREVRSMMEHLKIRGVPTQWVTRDAALDICISLLGV